MPEESRDIAAEHSDSIENLPSVFPSSSVEENRNNGYKDLEAQKIAFCIKYVTNGYKHREAAQEVGLNPDRGIHIKREPLVAAYIVDLQNKYLAESIVTKGTLDSYLDQLEDIAMGRISIPIITGSGDEINAKKFHADLAMKIYAERSKLHGIVEDDVKAASIVNVQINMSGLTGKPEVITINER